MHQIKRLVDVGQFHGVGDKRLQLDLALHGVFHHAWQLAPAFHATKGGTFPGASCNQLKRTGSNFLPGTSNTNNHRLAPATVRAFQRRTHDVNIADALE